MTAPTDWSDTPGNPGNLVTAARLNATGTAANTKYSPGGTDVALGDGGTGASLTDPGVDRLMFWDDSANTVAWLTPGTNLSITGTTLNATGGSGGGDASTNTATSVDSEAAVFSGTTGKTLKRATGTGIAKLTSGVLGTATAGTDYYNPSGTDVALGDGGTGASLADPNADRLMFWDDSANTVTWLTVGTNLSITGTTLSASSTTPTDGSVTTPKFAPTTLVTASETIGSNNNDTTIPTSAAVKAYADSVGGGSSALQPSGDTSGATDSAAIQAAHTALPAGGGEIRLAAGAFYLGFALNFTKQVKVVGAGRMKADTSGGTELYCNSATANGITSSSQGCIFEDFSIVNGSAGVVPTAGIGLSLTSSSFCSINRVAVHGFFDNIVCDGGYAWMMKDCHIQSPGRYGLRINNASNFDAGDMVVQGNWFHMDGAFANATSACRWETGGGLRFTQNKIIHGASYKWANGVDLAWNGNGTLDTSDIFIHDNSIENVANCGIKLSRTTGTHNVHAALLKNNEFLTIPTAIEVGPGWDGVDIEGNHVTNCTKGIKLLSGSLTVDIRPNTFWPAMTTCVELATGTAVTTTVAPQTIAGDGTIVTSVMDYLQGVPQIDFRYKRSIDWTVNATPVTMWTLGMADATSGIVEVRVAGFVNTVGGGVTTRKFAYTVANAGGAVTVTDIEAINHGANGLITTTTGTNSIAVKFSRADGLAVYGGGAEIQVLGHLTQFKRGA